MNWLLPGENFTDSAARIRYERNTVRAAAVATARPDSVRPRHSIPAHLAGSESLLHDYAKRFLKPYCGLLIPEYRFPNGLRPDIAFRLKGASNYLLTLEVKNFTAHNLSPVVEGIRQAHSYALQHNFISLVGPFHGTTDDLTHWQRSLMAALNLLAGQFSVGFLYCRVGRLYDEVGGIVIGNQIAVRFLKDGSLAFHSNYERLLLHKHGHGSKTWRESA